MQYDCLARKIFSDNYNCATYRKVGQTELLVQEKLFRDYAICFSFKLRFVQCSYCYLVAFDWHSVSSAAQ